MVSTHKLTYVEVVLPIPAEGSFTYKIPEDLNDQIKPGVQVLVPFATRILAGVVVKIGKQLENRNIEIKDIQDVVSPEPILTPELLKLLEWISNYYICFWGEAYRLVQPSLNIQKGYFQAKRKINITETKLSKNLENIFKNLPIEKWISLKEVEKKISAKNFLSKIQLLRKKGYVDISYFAPKPKQIYKTEKYFELTDNSYWSEATKKKYLSPKASRITKARELILFISSNGIKSKNELQDAGFNSGILKKLLDEGILKVSEKKVERSQEIYYKEEHIEIEITKNQNKFIQKVKPYLTSPSGFKTFLLHGITGSGKTQVYIELVKLLLPQNRQAIVLIPEIILTPQTTARFRNYFGDKVAVIHSKLSAGEKSEIIFKIREGIYSIIVGPRSAIFSPLKNLGLIIVDEEHESSYKQTDTIPRYNARDVALYRAYLNNIPIVLGSATPSFESLYNALNNKYEYFHLAYRINSRNLPRTRLVDLRGEWQRQGVPPLLSENLILKTESRLITKEQVMLLQNRRGHSPYLLCKECGYIKKCPNCDITLTYHFSGKNLCCHYCGFLEKAPDVCPQCRGIDILFKGFGTQKVEQYVLEEFKNARIQRMDQDTTKGKYGHDKILAKFRSGEVDILIGTKMIAKGLDFKKVSLVGVISADQGLNFPDFRASEKVFQMLTQVSGRAGRGENSGEVIIQTYDPEHYIFRFLQKNDYLEFYDLEIKTREALSYPPFSRLCLIRVIGEKEKDVVNYSQVIRNYLWNENSEKKFTILGPAPAPLVKLNNQYRYQILIKQKKEIDNSMKIVRRIIRQGLYNNVKIKNWPVKIQIDVDPLEMM